MMCSTSLLMLIVKAYGKAGPEKHDREMFEESQADSPAFTFQYIKLETQGSSQRITANQQVGVALSTRQDIVVNNLLHLIGCA